MAAVEAKKLTKKYKNKIAVDSIDFKVNEGELFGLLGVNGSRQNYYYSYDGVLVSSNVRRSLYLRTQLHF